MFQDIKISYWIIETHLLTETYFFTHKNLKYKFHPKNYLTLYFGRHKNNTPKVNSDPFGYASPWTNLNPAKPIRTQQNIMEPT